VAAFEQAFPADVLADDKAVRALNLLAKRIFTIQRLRPKYMHVVHLAIEATQVGVQCLMSRRLLTLSSKAFLQNKEAKSLDERKAVLEQFIAALPANVRIKERWESHVFEALPFCTLADSTV
jgi:hypothetical protein